MHGDEGEGSAMRIAIVSPHLDDAALSASAEIARGDVTVLTVFTAAPPADWPTSIWDRLTGASNSRQRQLERYDEDADAMRLLGADSIYLDELEDQYRDAEPDPDALEESVEQMARTFAAAEEVWIPSAIGGHVDHRIARDAALRAAARAGREEVVLYADFPYVITYDWPYAAVGRETDPYLDTDDWLLCELVDSGLDPASLSLTITKLDDEQRARKSSVIAAYRSQAPALRLSRRDLAAFPSRLDFELCWRMPVSAP